VRLCKCCRAAIICAGLLPGALLSAPPEVPTSAPDVVRYMAEELQRSADRLGLPGYQAPYFISYLLTDSWSCQISASFGAITSRSGKPEHSRTAYVEVRVGDYEKDSSGGDDWWAPQMGVGLPIEDRWEGLRAFFWLLTDNRYKAALEGYLSRLAEEVNKVEDEEAPADFSPSDPVVLLGEHVALELDWEEQAQQLREVTALFRDREWISGSRGYLWSYAADRYYCSTDGVLFADGATYHYLYLTISSHAKDGAEVTSERVFSRTAIADLPSTAELTTTARQMIDELDMLRHAEEMKPYAGPAVLDWDISSVLFHEAIGHRLEGERQRDDEQGKTFSDKVGERIIPEFLSIYDDPTLVEWDGVGLFGHYAFDDEGIAAQRANLVENGVLRGYLLSRTPIKGFDRSNGHGRCDGMREPRARMANIVVESSKAVSRDRLKEMLLAECKRQGKPYGLFMKGVVGGHTNTNVNWFQAFSGTPRLVFRVDAETGEETLVRGVEILGTPISAANRVVATSDEVGVFNGFCGAESGQVPHSLVAPACLVSEIEVQRSAIDKGRPPILPPPYLDNPAAE